MASVAEHESSNAENIVRDIQTERMIYQINSASNARKATEKMKKSVSDISKEMENVRSLAYEKKLKIDELKITLAEKKEKMRKIQQEVERARKKVEIVAKKTIECETEENKIKTAIGIVKEAAESVDSKYLEQSQNELADSLIKASLDTEKAQSELNAAQKTEEIASKKLIDIQIEINKSEAYTIDKISESERIIANVATTIDHIIKSYEEISSVSKDLLNSAITTEVEFQNTRKTETQYYQQSSSITSNPNLEYA